MPNHTSTFRELYARQFNLMQFRHTYWAVCDISDTLKKEVNRYESFNQINLKRLLAKQTELYALYVESEPVELPDKTISSQFVFVQPSQLHIEGSKKRNNTHQGIDGLVPKFISAEAEDKFYDEWEVLMNTVCEITT